MEWEDELLRGTGLVQQGHVSLDRLRERPGLGIEFDEAVVKKHELAVWAHARRDQHDKRGEQHGKHERD